MKHKVALVTGGSRGLGRAVAEALLKKQVKVCLGDINNETGQKTLDELSSEFGKDKVEYAHCDVSKDGQLRSVWEKCTASLGAPDLLVNNAAVADEENWQKTLDINLGGVISGTLLAMEHWSKLNGGSGGRVVNVASIAGIHSLGFAPAYSATKSGVIGFTKALGQEFHYTATGVKVQCICPDIIRTPFYKEATRASYFTDLNENDLRKALRRRILLLAPEVASAMMNLIEEGPNGGVMVVEPTIDPYYHASPSSLLAENATNVRQD